MNKRRNKLNPGCKKQKYDPYVKSWEDVKGPERLKNVVQQNNKISNFYTIMNTSVNIDPKVYIRTNNKEKLFFLLQRFYCAQRVKMWGSVL